jgi:predicted RNA-binding Zn ribbon-like protein
MNANQDFLDIRLDGGNLSLDFVNTIHDRYEEPFRDYIHNYPELVTWSHFAGGIDEIQKKKLLQLSQENKKGSEQVYLKSIQLREAIYNYILYMNNQDKVPTADSKLINQWLSRAFSNLELVQVKSDVLLNWNPENLRLESVLWPIIKSFVDLITSDMRRRIKQCPNCGWVFVDKSKNKSRRWCSMDTCGNRIKAQRYAQKNRP